VNITLRAYEGLDDLRGMRDVVGEGLALAPARSYVHPGDVTWWLSFPPRSREALAAMAAVWERDGRIEGWVVADGEDVGSAVRPRWLDDPAADAFDDAVEGWLEVHTTSPIRYIAEDDRVQVARARRLGYGAVEDGLRVFRMSLPASPRAIAATTRVRALTPGDDPTGRAAVTHAAFGSAEPFATYVEDYRGFMRVDAYRLGWDLVAETEDGLAAACCIAWPDPVSRSGNFEPVATHPDHRRRGYASAVMTEGLRRSVRAGMSTAIVRTAFGNHVAASAYLSLGFTEVPMQRAFVRRATGRLDP
jgi:GNAT superfamily N-acetyltransferase